MTTEKIAEFAGKLEAEKALIESELQSVGRRNPDVAGDWEAQPKDTDTASTEPDEKADKFEEFEENLSITENLEARLRAVIRAQGKIAEGGYGGCEVCGAEIEEARLDANPAARTCKAHMDEEKDLSL